MTNETKNEIIRVLLGVTKKMEKCTSISAKRKFLLDFLSNSINYMDVDEDIDLDSEELAELISNNFLAISEPPKCFEDDGFVPWLNDYRTSIDWKFYDRYEKYLLYNKLWDWSTVSSIKQSTDIILDHMANPKTNNYFGKQGLVIGDIQSGKTANYTALINKAIDAGYKIVIVLAGLTKDLRNQTQRRIDKEVLGYETKSNQKGKTIGVGKVSSCSIEGLTYADEKKDFGDFKKYFNGHTLDRDNMVPLVAIVKKNKSVLKNVSKFLNESQRYCYTDGKLDAPVLIIDDEVDQASVDTKNSKDIDSASAINKGIRTILNGLNRYAYVGYTATPFANVFIDPDNENDLYPKDFILSLTPSSKYCGIKEYFELGDDELDDTSQYYSRELFRNIDDFYTMYDGDKLTAQTVITNLSESLKKAIRSFIVAASIKKSRNIVGHNSMLIHIARFKNPSTTLKPLVESYLNELYKRLKYEYDDEIEKYKNLWSQEFETTSKHRLSEDYNDSWEAISKHLLSSINSAVSNVKVVNGDLNEQIDYEETSQGEHIIIGGDKLSRGLTLDGLIISYYYRRSKMYDSLLQMGRWFGYRDGWIDVCRVYTTYDIMYNFIAAGKALQKFKDDIDEMYLMKKNPREVGQKIMYSPCLIPTSYSKMRGSNKVKISFSEEVQQIISFSKKNIKHNFDITCDFIKSLDKGIVRDYNKVVFKKVSVKKILKYLSQYADVETYKSQISIKNWINYIKKVNEYNELTEWTVVLNSLKTIDESKKIKIENYTIYKPSRTLREEGDSNGLDTYLIKANIDPTDFKEIFDENSENYFKVDHFDKRENYPEFNSRTGLLSIYIEDFYEKKLKEYKKTDKGIKPVFERGKKIEAAQNVVGPAIWFPKTRDVNLSAVEYYVNKDYKRNRMQEDEFEDEYSEY